MQSDFIFRLTDDHRRHEECLKILHGFSYGVIRERKEQIKMEQKQKQSKNDSNNNQLMLDENGNEIRSTSPLVDEEESFGKKKRLAFLDLLISASGNGSVLTDEDIREEVDTFVSYQRSSRSTDVTLNFCMTTCRCLKATTQPRRRFRGACF